MKFEITVDGTISSISLLFPKMRGFSVKMEKIQQPNLTEERARVRSVVELNHLSHKVEIKNDLHL